MADQKLRLARVRTREERRAGQAMMLKQYIADTTHVTMRRNLAGRRTCGEMWGDVGRCGETWGDVGRHEEQLGGAADHGGDVGHTGHGAPVVRDKPREADGVLQKYRSKYRSSLLHYLVEQSHARGRARRSLRWKNL